MKSCSESTSSGFGCCPNIIRKTVLLWLAAVTFPSAVHTELFSATAKLPKLLYTQKAVIGKLDEFIDKEHELFAILMKLRDRFQRQQNIAIRDTQYYIAQPVNAFVLIKSLTVDVKYVMEKLEIFSVMNLTYSLQWPTDRDLVGACKALVRLQDTYKLSAADLAEGKLGTVKYSSPMSSGDCFGLARVLYSIGQHNNSNTWLQETLKKIKSDGSANSQWRCYVMEFVANNYYKMGRLQESLHWLDQIIDEFPEGHSKLEKRKLWGKELIEKNNAISNRKVVTSYKKNVTGLPPTFSKSDEKSIFEALCRGELKVPDNVTKRFKCRYDTSGLHIKFASFKVEEVYLNPDILVYYDVISDHEIDYIKTLTLKEMRRATGIYTGPDGQVKSAPHRQRVSQVGSFDDSDAAVARISRRAGRISRLTLATAEPVHVGCYGIGGFFSPHYDMVQRRRTETGQSTYVIQNKVMATVLFYMTDVKLGGDTVFTELGISIPPRKGSAVTWRNVLSSTEMDLRTRHAGCPVLLGTKWIINKWFHEVGQEFVAPCTLQYQREEDTSAVVKFDHIDF